jgi:aminoglycoside N3'-acetyltransferase
LRYRRPSAAIFPQRLAIRSLPWPTAGVGRIDTRQITEVDRDMGVLAAVMVAHPNHVRGEHPLCSFSALGHHVAELIAPQRPDDVYTPLTMLARRDGFVRLIGVGLNKMTLLTWQRNKLGDHYSNGGQITAKGIRSQLKSVIVRRAFCSSQPNCTH